MPERPPHGLQSALPGTAGTAGGLLEGDGGDFIRGGVGLAALQGLQQQHEADPARNDRPVPAGSSYAHLCYRGLPKTAWARPSREHDDCDPWTGQTFLPPVTFQFDHPHLYSALFPITAHSESPLIVLSK